MNNGRCDAEVACAASFPRLRARLDTVLARAEAGHVRAAVPDGAAGDSVRLSRDAVAATLLTALQSASTRARLPALLHRAASGDATPLASLVVQLRRALDQEIAFGMHLSVSCGEDGRHIDTLVARRDDGRTFLGAARVRMLARACAEWIVPPPTPEAHAPVRSAVPVLLVSGELDPNTPPRHAQEALRHLPNGRHVILRGVSHGWSNVAGCGAAFVADFVARGSARSLDLGCAEVSSAPPMMPRMR